VSPVRGAVGPEAGGAKRYIAQAGCRGASSLSHALEPTPTSLRSCVAAVLGAAHRQRSIAHGTRQQAAMRTTLRVLA
jgi:hypothetical protein